MEKYRTIIDGKKIYSDRPIITACGECSNNMNGVWGMYEHIGSLSCDKFSQQFKKTIKSNK